MNEEERKAKIEKLLVHYNDGVLTRGEFLNVLILLWSPEQNDWLFPQLARIDPILLDNFMEWLRCPGQPFTELQFADQEVEDWPSHADLEEIIRKL